MRTLILSTALLAAASAAAPAQAGPGSLDACTHFIDSLPVSINQPGVWCLRADLATDTSDSQAIYVSAKRVVIDCNSHAIDGSGGGADTLATGIYASHADGLVVRNCTIRGFRTGLYISDINLGTVAAAHRVEDNVFDRNTEKGMEVRGIGALVRRNLVSNTGGNGIFAPMPIFASPYTLVIDNTIAGTAPRAGSGFGSTGIYGGQVVAGNRIGGLRRDGGGVIRGIRTISEGSVVRDNQLTGSGLGTGIECSDGNPTTTGNVLTGYATAISGCYNSGNRVAP